MEKKSNKKVSATSIKKMIKEQKQAIENMGAMKFVETEFDIAEQQAENCIQLRTTI